MYTTQNFNKVKRDLYDLKKKNETSQQFMNQKNSKLMLKICTKYSFT